MEIKELSEIMEAKRQEAAPFVIDYLRAAKAHEKACLAYYKQCRAPRNY